MRFSRRWIRKYERALLITLAVLLAAFFGAGYGVFRILGAVINRVTGQDSGSGPEAVGRIFGAPIDPGEFFPFRNRWLRFPFAADNMEQANTAYASVRLAQRLGIRVSDDEVRAFVMGSPAFREDPSDPKGHFSHQRFRELLDRYRITQQEFEQTVRELLAARKLQGLLFDAAVVTSAQVWPAYRDSRLSYRTAAVRFALEDFLAQVPEPDDQKVQEFYQAEKEGRYREPARIKVEVLVAPYEGFLAGITVNDEEAQQYYQEHRREFVAASPASGEGPEPAGEGPPLRPFAEVRDEIVERLRRERARQQALSALSEARDKLQADPQTSPARLAADSEGRLQAATTDFFAPAEVAEVPLLGAYFEPGDPFVSSLFALKEEDGRLSEVAPGAEAAVLSRLVARRESRVPPLEEVRERVVEDLRRSQAADEARRQAEELARELGEKKVSLTSEEFAQRGQRVETSSWFALGGAQAPEYARAPQPLWGRRAGEVLVAETEDAAFVVEVLQTRPPGWEEFQEVWAGVRALENLRIRQWLLPARWDEIVRRETGLELSLKPESAEEKPAEGTSGSGPAAGTGAASEPAESAPQAPSSPEAR